MSFDGVRHTCDHCGKVIEKTASGHDWIGPLAAPGEKQRHYHLSPEYPQCRIVGGAVPMPWE